VDDLTSIGRYFSALLAVAGTAAAQAAGKPTVASGQQAVAMSAWT